MGARTWPSFSYPDSRALLSQLFFYGIPIEADLPLANTTGAATASFFFFGFRISRLLRFCPFAIVSSCTHTIGHCARHKGMSTEEHLLGNEGGSKCRSRGSTYK